MQFDEAVRYLLSLGTETLAIKLGLKNTELLLSALGNPQKSYRAVQIAGTNGKGSTAVFLHSVCNAAGIKTGLFTSPHLVSIRERIRLGKREISEKSFASAATQVRHASETIVNHSHVEALPTFFEQVTAIALSAFRQAGMELAVLETGLGGRLDATTVVRAELVGITPIALDHEKYLGNTIESIAAEKAAIIREGVAAVVAPQTAPALRVILNRARRCQVAPAIEDWSSTVKSVTKDGRLTVTLVTDQDEYQNLLIGLRGRHQVDNAAVAIRLAERLREMGFAISRSAIIDGIRKARHAGRLELWPGIPPMLFDGAHNPSGAQALRDYLDEFVTAPVTIVYGAMRDKNLAEMATKLFPRAQNLILTVPDNARAAPIELLSETASSLIEPRGIYSASSINEAIRIAKRVTPPNGLICITGSLYLVGEVQGRLRLGTAAKTAKPEN